MPKRSIKYQVLSIKYLVQKNTRYIIHNTKYRKSAGFTLIELLTVIALIGILTTIGYAGFNNAQQKSRDSRRKQDLKTISAALVSYYQDFGAYPAPCTGNSCSSAHTPRPWIPALQTTYLQTLPMDPRQPPGSSNDCSGAIRVYCYTTDGDSFVLWAQLENTNDLETVDKPTAKCTLTPSASAWNYCIESPK